MPIAFLALLSLLSGPAHALDFGAGLGKQLENAIKDLRSKMSVLNASAPPCDEATAGAAPAARWVPLTPAQAQCTPGARKEGHHAKVRLTLFPKDVVLQIVPLPNASDGVVKSAIRRYPRAMYVGNGPIFMDDGKPNGLVKSQGRTYMPIDCFAYRTNTGNLGRDNAVFVRYRPRKGPPHQAGRYENEWRYRVISSQRLCSQFQTDDYLYWLKSQNVSAESINSILRSGKKSELEGEDLVEPGQIDFAIQSGPGVLIGGNNMLEGYNRATGFRSYIGVNENGDPVILEADGNIGSYCMGEYAKSQGVRDLLHRDSFVSDAVYRETDGTITGYPSENRSAAAASLLVISPRPVNRVPRLPW